MKTATSIAIQKALAKTGKSKDLIPGEHTVDEVITLHVTGTVKKGDDYEQVNDAKIDWQALALAALSSMNGNTRNALVNEFLNDKAATDDRVKAEVEAANHEIKGTAVVTASGKTTHKSLSIEIITESDNVKAA